MSSTSPSAVFSSSGTSSRKKKKRRGTERREPASPITFGFLYSVSRNNEKNLNKGITGSCQGLLYQGESVSSRTTTPKKPSVANGQRTRHQATPDELNLRHRKVRRRRRRSPLIPCISPLLLRDRSKSPHRSYSSVSSTSHSLPQLQQQQPQQQQRQVTTISTIANTTATQGRERAVKLSKKQSHGQTNEGKICAHQELLELDLTSPEMPSIEAPGGFTSPPLLHEGSPPRFQSPSPPSSTLLFPARNPKDKLELSEARISQYADNDTTGLMPPELCRAPRRPVRFRRFWSVQSSEEETSLEKEEKKEEGSQGSGGAPGLKFWFGERTVSDRVQKVRGDGSSEAEIMDDETSYLEQQLQLGLPPQGETRRNSLIRRLFQEAESQDARTKRRRRGRVSCPSNHLQPTSQ